VQRCPRIRPNSPCNPCAPLWICWHTDSEESVQCLTPLLDAQWDVGHE
jgi:hypothetical protein